MLKVLIVEDELIDVENLRQQFDIIGVTDSVEAAVNWLKTHASPDLVLINPRLFNNKFNHETGNGVARSRILIRKGIEYISIKLENAAYFYTEHRLVFLVDKDNRKHITENKNLSQLMECMDPRMFYRVNRKYVVNINFVKRFMPKNRTKMVLELTLPVEEEILISQEKTTDFKQWVESL